MDSITCVVDAEQVFANPEYPGVMELKLRQIASADMLILNKVDSGRPGKGEEDQEMDRRSFQQHPRGRDQFLRCPLRDLWPPAASIRRAHRPPVLRPLNSAENHHIRLFTTWS